MTRPVHLDNLRRVDPVTLDILVQDALRRPITQLSGVTLASLCALSELEALPRALRKALVAFAERAGQELADLPDGQALEAELTELSGVPAAQIPETLRAHLVREADATHRSEIARGRVQALVTTWADTPPEAVALGSGRPVIHKSAGPTPAEETRRRANAAQRSTEPRAERAPRAEKPAAPRAAPVRYVDEARRQWLIEQILERLSSYLEHGLLEDVLIAGVRHRARASYPDLTSNEVAGLLKELQASGRARCSAGRWRRILGGW